jgi:geranylgeranyl pyrophosphate synthase
MKRVLDAEDIAKMIEILDSAGARETSQAKAQELVEQALAGLDGVPQQGMDALKSLGQWAAEGGR